MNVLLEGKICESLEMVWFLGDIWFSCDIVVNVVVWEGVCVVLLLMVW